MLFITKRAAERREQELKDEIERLRDELVFEQNLHMSDDSRRLDAQVKELLDWDCLVERGVVRAWDSPSLRLGLKASALNPEVLRAVTYDDSGKAWRAYVSPADAADAYKERFLASA